MCPFPSRPPGEYNPHDTHPEYWLHRRRWMCVTNANTWIPPNVGTVFMTCMCWILNTSTMGRDHQKHVASFVDAKGSGLKKEVLLANTTDMLSQTPLDVYIAQKGKAHFNKKKVWHLHSMWSLLSLIVFITIWFCNACLSFNFHGRSYFILNCFLAILRNCESAQQSTWRVSWSDHIYF